MVSTDEKHSPIVEDPPLFADTYPGRRCCLCNRDERSCLGQGDLLQLEVDLNNPKILPNPSENENAVSELLQADDAIQSDCRRVKSKGKFQLKYESINELDRVGQSEALSVRLLLNGTHIYIHRMCALWSLGPNYNKDDALQNIDAVVEKCLKQRCTYCGLYGASVACKLDCNKMYHLPCAAASECFLILESFTAFCSEHLHEVPVICSESNIACRQCSIFGDLNKLIMCSTCGDHYHTTCIGLTNLPDTRSGWNCAKCNKCQICRQADTIEVRYLKCEQCQKLYHATCLRPVISSIPKFGWKCNRCRVCTDCGSRTPGAGTSSRWHCHYTICDSCYQQRNKGFSCPICHKAYRAAAHKEMVKCSRCHRFVHSSCDEEADLTVYHKRKENNPDYDYFCPSCKPLSMSEKSNSISSQLQASSELSDIHSLNLLPLEGNFKETDVLDKNLALYAPSEGKNLEYFKIGKKRMSLKDLPRARGKGTLQKPNVFSQFGRKRNAKKNRHLLMNSINTGGSSDRGKNRSTEEDLVIDKKLLLFSAKDKYILSQDVCVMCGSIGLNEERCLIACVQCGQCFHPYCVNIKVSKVILQKGWRCIDCTVCEGCGQKTDEARLILCDECDLSYHIYCMSPPLETVPHGNWKCKWCALCQKCGLSSSGKHSVWRNGSLECGPCASQEACSVCLQSYVDNDLIIQCKYCKRWLHCLCDSMNTLEEAESCDRNDYRCVLCRPKGKAISHSVIQKCLPAKTSAVQKAATMVSASTNALNGTANLNSDRKNIFQPNSEPSDSTETTHCVDGVYINERGLSMIKSLTAEMKRKRKLRPAPEHQKKNPAINSLINSGINSGVNSGIMAAIESVVAGSSNPNEDGTKGNESSKQNSEILKDGMLWTNHSSSPPEGFSISINEDGKHILRKKRQRNLQKLGIGGFTTRNRACKKETDDIDNALNTLYSGKKKKIVRKKLKNKLSETYPAYLQEAFFGKTLLEHKEPNFPALESDVPDDAINRSITDHKMFSDQSLIESKVQKRVDIHTLGEKTEVVEPYLESSTADSKSKLHSNNPGIEECQPPQKSNLTAPVVTSNEKDSRPQENTFSPIASSEIVSKVLSVVLDQATPGVLNTEANIPLLKVPSDRFEKLNEIGSELGTPILTNKTQLGSSNQILQSEIPEERINVPYTMLQLKMPHPDPAPTIDNFAISLNQGQTECTNQVNPSYLAAKPAEKAIEATVAGTQKTAEKMRRDEDLGEMATISAVLYANTQHPELKQTFPNWNDRCKQILKKWRALTTDKKAPFLQHAKDNRSALRMRKAQQDSEKIPTQHKNFMEQEQERMWKKHQAKAKEVQCSNIFNGDNNIYGTSCESESSLIDVKPSVVYFPSNVDSTNTNFANSNLSNLFRPNPAAAAQRNVTQLQPSNLLHKTENYQGLVDVDNKQLRTLLLKEGSTMSWMLNPGAPNMFPNAMIQPQLDLQKVNMQPLDVKRNMSAIIAKSAPLIVNPQERNDVSVDKQDPKCRSEVKMPEATSELEQYENAGLGDILGGLGEGDDDDLFSLTAEIGDDFNILEYADPELDELSTNQNLLNKLDFVDNDKNS